MQRKTHESVADGATQNNNRAFREPLLSEPQWAAQRAIHYLTEKTF